MADKSRIKPIASALGISLAATLSASPIVHADQNPFALSEINGYMTAGDHEGKCGEGKCGGDDKGSEGKCGEGKCGG